MNLNIVSLTKTCDSCQVSLPHPFYLLFDIFEQHCIAEVASCMPACVEL